MVFRRIGDIALFTTGLFPEAMLRQRRLETYEDEGRRFYRLAAERLEGSHPRLAEVLGRLAGDFTVARKPLNVLSERYVAWARPHWRQVPS
jgi:hypothetical protein